MNMALRNSVVIADDHRMFREGLRVLLEVEGFHVVGEAKNGQEAIRLTRQHNPQVAVLDYSMPVLNGLDTAREIQRQSPQTAVVLLTMYDSRLNLSKQVKGEAEEYFGAKVFKTSIPRNVRLAEAPSHGLPGVLYDRHSRGARAYMNLAREAFSNAT